MTIAASGLQTSMRAFTAHAANIVNAQSAVQPAPSNSAVYQPTTIVRGLVPGGDTAGEIVGALQAANNFRADAAVLGASAKMFKSLLDIVA